MCNLAFKDIPQYNACLYASPRNHQYIINLSDGMTHQVLIVYIHTVFVWGTASISTNQQTHIEVS